MSVACLTRHNAASSFRSASATRRSARNTVKLLRPSALCPRPKKLYETPHLWGQTIRLRQLHLRPCLVTRHVQDPGCPVGFRSGESGLGTEGGLPTEYGNRNTGFVTADRSMQHAGVICSPEDAWRLHAEAAVRSLHSFIFYSGVMFNTRGVGTFALSLITISWLDLLPRHACPR